MRKRVLISVTSDLVTDQRVHKVSQTLHEAGYDILLIGRRLKTSLPLEKRDYQTRRFRLWFTKTALFYMNYNTRLFFFLLLSKADILLSNDLDTLPANYLVSLIRNKPLVYDSHEYFTGVPELQHRKGVRKIWELIEGFIFPRLRFIYTVNRSIAKLYEEKYGKEIRVVRNVPYYSQQVAAAKKDHHRKILIYQGSGINVNRGAEELVLSMQYLDPALFELWIVGGGDVYDQLKALAKQHAVTDRIQFIGKLPFSKLAELTRKADLGLTLDKPTNINYLYSLPNKIFDYLQAGIPVLASRLPEIAAVIEKYHVGTFIDNHEPIHIATRIREVFEEPQQYHVWKDNTEMAAKELCWDHEKKIVMEIFRKVAQQESDR